jgi:putative ABC transport system substrate-binding protein
MAQRKVGFFHNGTKGSFQKHFAAFVRRMYEFVGEGDVKIIERWAGDETAKTLEQHAQDLVGQSVDVIVAAGGPPSALAAKKATIKNKVPVVFMSVADPVGLGLIASLDNPKGNMTGIAGLTSELDVTRLELLRELLAGGGAARIGVLNNGNRPHLAEQYKTLSAAASGLNLTLVRKDVVNLVQIEAAFKSFKGEKADALLVTADSLFNDLRKHVVKFAKRVPAIYQWREFAEAGGLMSFGPNIIEAYEQVGEYVGHILDGEAPSDLPVALPDRLELVINLRVAHAEGIHIPASLLSRAEFVRRRLRTRRARELSSLHEAE